MTDKKNKKVIPPKNRINYLYFGSFFLLLFSFSIFQMLSLPKGISLPLFFSLSFLQILLELSFFICLMHFTQKWYAKLMISLTFFLVIIMQAIHIILVHLMDSSITEVIKLFILSGWDDFFIMLRAINSDFILLICIVSLLFALPLFAYFLYRQTERFSSKKPIFLSSKHLLILLITLLPSLLITDFFLAKSSPSGSYSYLRKKLPFSLSIFSPKKEYIYIKNPLRKPLDEKEAQSLLSRKTFAFPDLKADMDMERIVSKEKTASFPDIYLFVVESLRRDFIEPTIAPNLFLLADSPEMKKIEKSFSNANFSPMSWFSIFHSQLPHKWVEVKKEWKKGSLPLQILKKMGYNIHVLSSAELALFQVDTTIFGKEKKLADTFEDFSNTPTLSQEIRDRRITASLLSRIDGDLHEQTSPHLYIIFLDSTHSSYSWPDDFSPPFTPYAPYVNYLKLTASKEDLPLIINRYKNAIFYVDSLIGSVIQKLQDKGIWSSSMMIVTGDHGEEFFEEGAIFHTSHLNQYQTSVPILYKFPQHTRKKEIQTTLTSHIDIFPTILEYLSGETFHELLDGRSIFEKREFAISFHQNSSFTPYEFIVRDGIWEMRGSFSDGESLFRENRFAIRSLEKSQHMDSTTYPKRKKGNAKAKKKLISALEELSYQ